MVLSAPDVGPFPGGELKVVAVIDRTNDMKIMNPGIVRLYKPFFILPVVMILNDEKIIQGMDTDYYSRGKFVAPGTSVLVVDDNLMNIRVLEGLLSPYKIKVSMATSGAEALEKIESMDYDVVFMDHMMPEMDGIETLLPAPNSPKLSRRQKSIPRQSPSIRTSTPSPTPILLKSRPTSSHSSPLPSAGLRACRT